MIKYWPIVFLYNKLLSLFDIKIAYSKVVAISVNELYFNIFQDIKKVLVMQNLFDIILTF